MSERRSARAPSTAPVDALARLRAAGQRGVLVTVAGSPGGGRAGVLVLGADGRVQANTFEESALADAASALARAALADPAVRRRWVADPAAPDTRVELVAEVAEPEPAVLVLGSGEVARALARLARALPARVSLLAPGGAVDVPQGVEVRADDPARVLLAAPPGRQDAVVLCDVAAAWAQEAVRVALASEAAFVGAVTDDAEARQLTRALTDAGLARERLARLRAPAGLSRHAAEPGDVALAVLAQAAAARRERSR